MIDHNYYQSDLPIKMQILNISVNMARMGELVLKFGSSKLDLVNKFLDQTESYLEGLNSVKVSVAFKPTLTKFNEEFKKIRKQPIEENEKLWGERAITWGDILQIRTKLLSN